MKVDGSLKSLLQGVSQQPTRDRLPGQCTAQENMSSDPISGLTRRPPTDLVGSLGSSSDVRGWHNFETSDGRKFLAFFHDSVVDVFDLNAEQQAVTHASGSAAYIKLLGSMRFSTIEDETYVVNRTAVPTMTGAVPTYIGNGVGTGIIQVLGGAYARKYSITLDGVDVAWYKTPDGSEAREIDYVRTTYLAEVLEWLLTHPNTTPPASFYKMSNSFGSNPFGNTTNWEVKRFEDTIYIRKKDGKAFTLGVNDDAGNKNLKCMTASVPGVEDLPRLAPHLYVARVAEKTDPDQDLWFKYIVEGQEANLVPSVTLFGKPGYWQECTAPGTKTTVDAATMPHVLEYDTDTMKFTFRKEAWGTRGVGTEVSNPDPSFIGTPIQDVGNFQGRLVFVAGSNVVMSRTNKNRDFFFGSVSAQSATDPIDVRSKVEASTMLAAVQHNRDLVVFSNKGQFVIFGRNVLTPENAALVLTSAFEAELRAKPVAAGRNVFFATNYGQYTGMREFFAEGGTEINDSRPISQHVKQYVVGKVRNLTASSNYDTLIVQTDQSGTDLYVYQYIWADNEKVQSSWSKWLLAHNIVHSFFDEELVYMIQQIGTEFYLLRMSLDVQDSTGIDYPAFLDQRFDVFDAYEAFTLPYDYMHLDDLVVVQCTNCPNPGLTVPIKSIVWSGSLKAYVVTLKKNMLGGDLLVGTRFKSRYVPTMPVVKDQDGVAIATGKLRLRALLASLNKTGHIAGQVKSRYGDGPVVQYNGRTVGSVDNIVGVQTLSNSTFTMPFRQNAQLAEVEFFTESHLPMTMLDIEWVGQYSKRGRRISTGG